MASLFKNPKRWLKDTFKEAAPIVANNIMPGGGFLVSDNPAEGVINTVAPGVGAGISAITGSSNEDALNAQRDATNAANQTLRDMYMQQREDLAPWRDTGAKYLAQMDADFGDNTRTFTMADFMKDPGYQFRMDEGLKALERSAIGRGQLNSGRTMKALNRYGQDYASNEFQNAYNRFNNDRDQRFNKMASLAGIGQTATSQLVNAGGQYGQNVANNQIGYGNAVAANNIAQQQMWYNLLGQGLGAAGYAYGKQG